MYSGAISGRWIGVYPRVIASESLNVNRFAWSVARVRQYGVAPEHQGMSAEEASQGVRTKQAEQFDWALAKMDSSVRRTGRITRTLLQRIFHDIVRGGHPGGNQALLLLRSCGSLLPEVSMEERTKMAHHIWDKLEQIGVSYDVSHFNALLKVYLQNEHKFSPSDFLAKMESANVQPNRVTYQRLIAAYCQVGDVEGASAILGYMKSKDLPITEAVFNSLVTGHACAGDMESAENILSIMRGAGIEPGPNTYLSLLLAYAEKGLMEKITQTLEMVENSETNLVDRELMQLVFTLARAGYAEHVPQVMEKMRKDRGYVPDAMNLCLSLITHGHEDVALTVLKDFPMFQMESNSGEDANMGNFFLRHCVNMDKPAETVVRFCKELKDGKFHSTPLQFALLCALEAGKTGQAVDLMKSMKEEGLPIRIHYFWPLLNMHQKQKNVQGTVEVMRHMQDLDVLPDMNTYSTYLFPAFPTMEDALAALTAGGCAVDSSKFMAMDIRAEASRGNLSGLLSLMCSPSLPAIDLSIFKGSLIIGFKKSTDIESMAKVTELLYNDDRFRQGNSTANVTASYFLYQLIYSMTSEEVKDSKEKLRQYFSRLKSLNVTISESFCRGITNLLEPYNVPELSKDVGALVDRKAASLTDLPPSFKQFHGQVPNLEMVLKDSVAKGKAVGPALKRLIFALCSQENLDRALELKNQFADDMLPGGYAALISLCSRIDNAEEALNLKRELSRKDPDVALDASKYVALVRVLSKHDKVEEAVDMLKEVKEKNVEMNGTALAMLSQALNTIALKGDSATIRRLQETIFTLNLAKPSNNLCAPLVVTYLERKDIDGALDAAIECQEKYGQMPRIHDIICALVEKGDTERLQKAMDFLSQERGEMTMLYDLYFAFMQMGRYREARKIMETPGLRARPGKLQWFAEKCIINQEMELLENMVEMTDKLFECDRDEMYHYMLRLCKSSEDWKKAETVWTKMQEENVIPRERTLRLLASILKSHGQPVPFEVPEEWCMPRQEEADGAESPEEPKVERPPNYSMRLMALCKRNKTDEAHSVLKEADADGVVLGHAVYASLIKVLLRAGSIDDAIAVETIAASRIPGFKMNDDASNLLIFNQSKQDKVEDALASFKSVLQREQVPSQPAINRLVKALGNSGHVEGIQEVENLVKSLGSSFKMPTMLFTNNKALAHIRRGDMDSAVEILESFYTQDAGATSASNISYIFQKVLEENNEGALDKLSVMAERLANHFALYRPATDMFLQLVEFEKTEEAKFLLQRCSAVAEQKDRLLSYMTQMARQPGKVNKILIMSELVPDFVERRVLNSYLMKCHAIDEDLAAAKALYERILAEGMDVDELSLKRLAQLYRNAGQTVPFEEPPRSYKFYADKLRMSSAQSSPEGN